MVSLLTITASNTGAADPKRIAGPATSRCTCEPRCAREIRHDGHLGASNRRGPHRNCSIGYRGYRKGRLRCSSPSWSTPGDPVLQRHDRNTRMNPADIDPRSGCRIPLVRREDLDTDGQKLFDFY